MNDGCISEKKCKAHARSKTWIKCLDPLISQSIGYISAYISAGGNVGYIFCIGQSQFNTWQDGGNMGR